MLSTSLASSPPYRLLTLEGETGAVFCRVHDSHAKNRLPSFSEAGRIELGTRTLARMVNLTAFRGRDRSGSMVGPADYYCNVERPHEKTLTIAFPPGPTTAHSPPPTFVPHPLTDRFVALKTSLRAVTDSDVATVSVRWFSGKKKSHAQALKHLVEADYKGNHKIQDPFGGSLFPDPGLLEIDCDGQHEGCPKIYDKVYRDSFDSAQIHQFPVLKLPAVDATTLDLTPFGARLVRNDQPFHLIQEELSAKDEYRPVSYEFGTNYHNRCVERSGGLFLETHGFTQTMTPLDPTACGFITLGRWRSKYVEDGQGEVVTPLPTEVAEDYLAAPDLSGRRKKKETAFSTTTTTSFLSSSSSAKKSTAEDEEDDDPNFGIIPDNATEHCHLLDLIAVRIPFGYTLLVDGGCIHGDSTFIGPYMMSMTSNHVTMNSADTVFLKDAKSKRNVVLACPQHGGGDGSGDIDPKSATAAVAKPPNGDGSGSEPDTAYYYAPKPIVVYNDATLEELKAFAAQTKDESFMLQPFSKISWSSTFFRRFGWYPFMPKK